ncbi:MAG: hypothetical protein WCD72_04035 [Dehalococcoidia bacterium]
MHKDLAQISKAQGIYRTLALLAILSPKLVKNETSKYFPKRDSHTTDEQVNVGDVDVKDECMASPR